MVIYSGFSHWKMVIFHSYVSLPEGNNWISPINFSVWVGKSDYKWVMNKCHVAMENDLFSLMIYQTWWFSMANCWISRGYPVVNGGVSWANCLHPSSPVKWGANKLRIEFPNNDRQDFPNHGICGSMGYLVFRQCQLREHRNGDFKNSGVVKLWQFRAYPSR